MLYCTHFVNSVEVSAMSVIADEVERLVPSSDSWPLVRGLIIGVAIGAAVAGAFVLARALQQRRAARREQGRPPAPPLGAEASPL